MTDTAEIDEARVEDVLRRSLSLSREDSAEPQLQPEREPSPLQKPQLPDMADVGRSARAVSGTEAWPKMEDENDGVDVPHTPNDPPDDETKPHPDVPVLDLEAETKPTVNRETPLRGLNETPPPDQETPWSPSPESPTTPATPRTPVTPEPPEDGRQCRICLGGVEDEVELGRLISPCLCAGSMRYVHVNCINEWRGAGANAKSFMECPQCGYEYHIRRTAMVGIATSRPLLMLLTSVIFFSTTMLAGHLMLKYLVAVIQAEEALKAAAGTTKKKARGRDDEWEYQTNIIFLGGTALIYDIVAEAVQTFVIIAGDVYDYFSDGGRLSNFILYILVRLLLGLALLGSVSGLTLLASLSLFAPMQIMYALRGTGLFDGLRRRVKDRNLTILVVLFVAVGIVNSVVQVYDFVRSVTAKVLRYVETQIVEVHSPEARAARRQNERHPGWWERWWAERRWRTAEGWREVALRARIAVKEWLRQWKNAIAAGFAGEHEPQAQPQPLPRRRGVWTWGE